MLNSVSEFLFPHSRLPIEWQCSDSVLSLVVAHHKKKCADFIDLKKLVSLAEAGVKQDPKRITGTPFLYEEPGSSSKKTSDVYHSPHRWVNCVGILSYSYVLDSASDVTEAEWCTMDGTPRHLNAAEQYARRGRKAGGSPHSRLIEAEAAIRHKRHRSMQQDRSIALDDAIELSNIKAFAPIL